MDYDLRAGAVVFGRVRYEPGGTCGPRVQPDYQLVLIEEGSVVIEIDDAVHRLDAGHVSLHLPGSREFFRFDACRPTVHSWCALGGTAVGEALRAVIETLPFSRPVSRRMEALIDHGVALDLVEDPLAATLKRKLGEAALLEFAAAGRGGLVRQALAPEPVLRAQRYIERNLAEPLTLDRLGDHSHVTPAHLIRLFRRYLGITPMQYLWEMRLRRARQLLTDTGVPIAEVAWQTGFKTAAHFARTVKERFGATPRAVRAKAWTQRQGTD